MRDLLKFLGSIAAAVIAVTLIKAFAFMVCSVDGPGLEPYFAAGDRVLINRWSYGLRTGRPQSLFDYGRICRQPVRRGDLIAFEDSVGSTLICRCTALPGDSVTINGQKIVVPSLNNCSDGDYYWLEPLGKHNTTGSRQLGFIAEHQIIGRVLIVLYNHKPGEALWTGYPGERILLLP